MNWKRIIPDYFVKRRNTVIQIVFTTIFAYVFILVYHPFGSQSWFQINSGQFAFYAGSVVVLGMLVVIISRVIMTQIQKRHPITVSGYALMVALEILAMTGFYMMIQKVFLKDDRFWFEVYYTAILNTSLILLIPYLISLLYFAWLDKKQNFEKLLGAKQMETAPTRFVNFNDENGDIRLTIQLDDLLYLEASENYVTIHYLDHNQPDRMLLRTSMKRMEEQLSEFPVSRCHRSYMVNLNRVRLAKKTKTGMVVELSASVPITLPVSETYKDDITKTLRM
ncbi:MAG: LytTR family DNA-binding domain-containing protein [Bacteroidales bacterium]|nr:LytTR family DNA-binding domain-containing protein [Bacteroidales bacterium]